MDKIKLYSKNNHIIPPDILNNFEYLHADIFSKSNIMTRSYKSDKMIVDIGCGTHIRTNPTLFLRENNVEQISPAEFENDFVPMLADELKINLDELKVTGLHWNQNVITQFTPAAYLSIFRDKARYDKKVYSNKKGLTYSNKLKSVVIYDKVAEMNSKKEPLPEDIGNLLRFELQIHGRLQHTTNLQNIETLSHITQPNNYNIII